ncbi:unnamed protein product [Euphydryas editha]|uniref:Uncharacterized protein n=1 Tax=Euphydryas editha TaxID=104508 RepID=A0AAU9U4D0_EUPED|nr:unnamed protein product [Euphydryas editha]
MGKNGIKGRMAGIQKAKDRNEIPNYICRINPDKYSIRVTRKISKIMNSIQNFNIIEVYRCMPLLGDEEKIPNWQVHIVKYSIVFKEVEH